MARRRRWERLSVRERWALIAMAVIVIGAASTSALWGVRAASARVTAWATSWRGVMERIRNPQETIVAQLAVCEGERASYATRLAEQQVTSKEYQDAAQFFTRPRDEAWTLVGGRVVAFAAGESQWRVRVDVGAVDGVAAGQAVLGPAGTLLGVIEQANTQSSVVRYTGSSVTRLAVSMVGSTATIGLLEGTDGEEMVIRYIPRGTPMSVGEIVVTSGLTNDIPIGLPVAVVKDIVDNESDPFLTARVVPLERAADTTTIAVVTL